MAHDILIMSGRVVLLLLCVQLALAGSTTYTGALSGQSSFSQLTFPTSAGNVISAYFKITNMDYSNVVMLLSFTPITLSLTAQQLSAMVVANGSQLGGMDVVGAIGDTPQVVNLVIPGGASTLYVGLFNFDLPEVTTSKSYMLTLYFSSNSWACLSCPAGTSQTGASLACQCSPCPQGYFGTTCRYSLVWHSGSASYVVGGGQNRYLLVASWGSKFEVSAREEAGSGEVIIYAQYQYSSGMLAGKINSIYNGSEAVQLRVGATASTLTLPNSGLPLLLTLHNYGSSAATILVSTAVQSSSSSVVVVVFAVVFGVLGVAVVVLVVCKLRSFLLARNSMVINASPALMADANSLTDQEIDKYFPEVSACVLLPARDASADSSELHLSDAESSLVRVHGQPMQLECSICFDELRTTDLLRVTYCRHIFHGRCLLEWFHKNQICPNCRQPYDYDNARRLRKALDRRARAAPDTLVRAILGEHFQVQLHAKTSRHSPNREELEGELEMEKEELEREKAEVEERVMEKELPGVEKEMPGVERESHSAEERATESQT